MASGLKKVFLRALQGPGIFENILWLSLRNSDLKKIFLCPWSLLNCLKKYIFFGVLQSPEIFKKMFGVLKTRNILKKCIWEAFKDSSNSLIFFFWDFSKIRGFLGISNRVL